MGILDNLTPKNILLSALKDKLGQFGITKIIMIYVIETEVYNVMLSAGEGNSIKLDISEKELSMLKKIYIRRIISKWKERYPTIEPKAVIMQVDFIAEAIDIFVQDKKDDVLKFEM